MRIDLRELRALKIFLVTPMHDGRADGIFIQSFANLQGLCHRSGIRFDYSFMYGDSLLPHARSTMVDTFLHSDATHLLWVDSDMGFAPEHVLAMLALQVENPEYDVLSGLAIKKMFRWKQIIEAIKKGVEDPEFLSNLGDFCFKPLDGKFDFESEVPQEVEETGMAFTMIPRQLFLEFRLKYPELLYETKSGAKRTLYYDSGIDPKTRRYRGEDCFFCHHVRDMDRKVFVHPRMMASHRGPHVFGGPFAVNAIEWE